MKKGCSHTGECGFYRKFGNRTSNTWRGLVDMYCRGVGAGMCERAPLLEQGKGDGIADDLMPIGGQVPQAFQLLP